MLRLNFDVVDARWQTLIGNERAFFRKLLRAAFATAELSAHTFRADLHFVDDATIKDLNNQHRGKNKPTNVLSFPLLDHLNNLPDQEIIHLGDIVMAFDTTKSEARAEKKTLRNHTAHLLVHGLLHLLTYDHMTKGDEAEMRGLEIHLLTQHGIRNPYQ